MRRREFIAGLAGAATWPVVARAQRPGLPVIGVISGTTAASLTTRIIAFRKGLGESGIVEGQNVTIEYRHAEGQYARLPELTADLVQQKVSVIAAFGGPAALAVKAATSTVPVVFVIGGDPVGLSLVPRLNRPGGNITGATFFAYELLSKQVGILHELIPMARVLGMLVNPRNPRAQIDENTARAAAASLGLELHLVTAATYADLDTAFASLVERHADMLVCAGDPVLFQFRDRLAALALRYAIAALLSSREYADAGALMAFGASVTDSYRQAGVYVGRILNGDRPGDLPVMQPAKFEFVINLKTANALGLTIPEALLATADEVIQ